MRSAKFWIIVERQNAALLEALTSAYRDRPLYEVVADRRVAHRRTKGREPGTPERRRRLADVTPFAIVSAADATGPGG